mgnify:CR=1 FL=1
MLTDAQKNALLTCVASEVQQATTYLASSLLADAQAELATARVTNDRLNRRVQIAESALNELNGNGQGAPNKIHREAWTRHQEAQAKLDRLRTGITALAKERGSQHLTYDEAKALLEFILAILGGES